MLSVAMIVKNEKKHLERAIKSVLPFKTELVIVDTGSTDGTIEIAKKYADIFVEEPWREDFGWHRNHSFGLCTQPWILGFDADEEFIFTDDATPQLIHQRLRDTLKDKKIGAIAMTVKDWREAPKQFVAIFDSLRFFKRGNITWSRYIHNKPSYKGDAVVMGDVFIKHYGYDLTQEQKVAKADRTIGLLKKAIKDNPDDFESMFYMAQAYAAFLNDNENAVGWAEKYIKYKKVAANDFNTSIYHLAAAIYLRQKNKEKAYEWIENGLTHDPQDLDLLNDLLNYGVWQQDIGIISTAAQRFIVCYDNFREIKFKRPGKFFFHYNPNSLSLALFYAAMGMLEGGTATYQRLLQLVPTLAQPIQQEVHKKMAEVLSKLKISFGANTPAPAAPVPASVSPSQIQNIPQNLQLPAL